MLRGLVLMTDVTRLTRPRRIFIAGSTGATGRTIRRLAGSSLEKLVLHRRPRGQDEVAAMPRELVLELGQREPLVAALRGCTTVVQLVGTTRRRFAQGDTYETSDIGTTRLLTEAARAAAIDHFILLSSVGAGRPVGAYLKAKASAEALVLACGLPYTIFRPSAFIGEGHQVPGGMAAATRLLRLDSYRPIAIEDLARTILQVALHRSLLGAILEGTELWKAVGEATKSR